jgi:hypothetical protein
VAEWSVARVEQLAPDAAAVKAAAGVAQPGKWRSLGRNERALWGECAGSGANPYQVRVDLEDAAYKCSCPSRKLPCKHALGLLLMFSGGTNIPLTSPPPFVEEWLAGRAKRAEAKVARASAPEKPPDPQAQARRAEKRESRIEAGLEQLEAWLADIVSQGLAAARAQSPQFWSQMAARLVDAQAPGLARRVSQLSDLAVSGEHWQSRLLAGLGRLQLLIDAYRRIDRLPPSLAAEVRTLVGWTQAQESLLERAGVRDRWHVLGHRQTGDERLRTQHTWLWGTDSARPALILEFAVGNQPLPATLRIGQVVDAELVYFDGAPPLRALIKERFQSEPSRHALPAPVDVITLQARFAALLAENPFMDRWPMVVGPVTTLIDGNAAYFVDLTGRRIAASPYFRHGWLFEALAGGSTLTVFGLWDGHMLDPLSVEHGGLFSLARIGDYPVLSKVA